MCCAFGIVHTYLKTLLNQNINYETQLLEMRSTIINSNGNGIYDLEFK